MHSEGRSCPGLHSAGPALCRILPSIQTGRGQCSHGMGTVLSSLHGFTHSGHLAPSEVSIAVIPFYRGELGG